MSNYVPAFKVTVKRRGRGKFKFVVSDYIGAVIGVGEARTQFLARRAGNDVKKYALKQYPGLSTR